jgi:hypothetical protein
LKGLEMKRFAQGLRSWGWTTKLASAAAAILFLIPVPAAAYTFLSLWSFNITTINAPAPVVASTDFAGGTNLTVNMGAPGTAFNRSSLSFFSASRDISVGPGGENINVVRSYQTLLQGASLQSLIYFAPANGTSANTDTIPNIYNSAGARFGRNFSFQDTAPVAVNLAPGNYTMFVRLKYKKDRYGIWDNSLPLPGSPHTFTITSAVVP